MKSDWSPEGSIFLVPNSCLPSPCCSLVSWSLPCLFFLFQPRGRPRSAPHLHFLLQPPLWLCLVGETHSLSSCKFEPCWFWPLPPHSPASPWDIWMILDRSSWSMSSCCHAEACNASKHKIKARLRLSLLVNWMFFVALCWQLLTPGHYENWQNKRHRKCIFPILLISTLWRGYS